MSSPKKNPELNTTNRWKKKHFDAFLLAMYSLTPRQLLFIWNFSTFNFLLRFVGHHMNHFDSTWRCNDHMFTSSFSARKNVHIIFIFDETSWNEHSVYDWLMEFRVSLLASHKKVIIDHECWHLEFITSFLHWITHNI